MRPTREQDEAELRVTDCSSASRASKAPRMYGSRALSVASTSRATLTVSVMQLP